MSVERMVRGSLLGAIAGKLVGDSIGAVADVLHAAGKGAERIADAAFYFEADAARRYRTLTGIDLGEVVGHDSRFEATREGYKPEIVVTWPDEDEEQPD